MGNFGYPVSSSAQQVHLSSYNNQQSRINGYRANLSPPAQKIEATTDQPSDQNQGQAGWFRNTAGRCEFEVPRGKSGDCVLPAWAKQIQHPSKYPQIGIGITQIC